VWANGNSINGNGSLWIPKVVVILGLPNGRKTNLLRFLERYFRTHPDQYNIVFIQDLIRNARISDELDRNLWAISQIHSSILEVKNGLYDLVVIERGAGAVYASLDWLLREGKLDRKQKEKAESGRRQALDVLRQEEDFFIFVDVSQETIIKRDEDEGRRIPGRVINSDFLNGLEESYQVLKNTILPKSRTKVVNGNLDLKKDWKQVDRCRQRTVRKLISLIPERPPMAVNQN